MILMILFTYLYHAMLLSAQTSSSTELMVGHGVVVFFFFNINLYPASRGSGMMAPNPKMSFHNAHRQQWRYKISFPQTLSYPLHAVTEDQR